MAQYLAVIKLTPSSTPSKVEFDAADVRGAIDKVLHFTHLRSTADIHEYEILEIVKGGYRPVATRLPMLGKPISHEVVGALVSSVPAEKIDTEERKYSGYAVIAT